MSREEAMAEMLQYFDKKAEVGIFWYHPVKDKLFEIQSIPVTSLSQGQLTYPKLHKTVWQKLRYQAKNDKKNGFPYDPIYLSDYVQVPRGRIFFRNNKFYVFVGSWINEKIKKMVIKEFNLQKCNVIFKIDIHWELGHGWSSEKDLLNFDD